MDIKSKYMIFCAIILFIAPIFLSSLTGNITASDWTYRHTQWIGRYIDGDLTPAKEYPPLFHLLMAPFVAMNFPVIWFQVLFGLLTIVSILYYVSKMENEKTLLYTAFFLSSSIAFVSFSGSLMPQALDYVFFPLILLAYFRGGLKNNVIMILGLILFFFMHLTGAVFTGILLIHAILTKRSQVSIILILGLIIMIPPYLWYTNPDAIYNPNFSNVWDSEAQAEWEGQYLKFPEFFIFSGFMIWLMLPFALKKLFDEREIFKIDDTTLLYIIWMVCLIPIAVFGLGYWRMVIYSILPLSLLIAKVLGNEVFK